MRRGLRVAATVGGVLALSATLLAVGAAVGSPGDDTAAPSRTRVDLNDPTARLQETLRRVPNNHRAWAELAVLYVDRARVTADPSLYAKADEAARRSLTIRPTDNPLGHTATATLAAARHDFAEALRQADLALADNDFDATTHGIRADALTELGRYDDALRSAQRMLELRPGSDAYARLSYQYELRGDVVRARQAMTAAAEAYTPADRAFALQHLGDLAFAEGDLVAARRSYDDALSADAAWVAATVGRARVLAAQGDTVVALAEYRDAVARQAQPAWVAELGELLEATGQRDAARQQYDVVRATQRLFAAGGVDVDAELAVFEADHGDPAAAVRLSEAAYRARPQAVFVADARAWALHKAGRSREALVPARTATRLGTRQPQLWYHLGAVEAANGNRDRARAALRTALDLNPAFSPLHAPAARRLLASLG